MWLFGHKNKNTAGEDSRSTGTSSSDKGTTITTTTKISNQDDKQRVVDSKTNDIEKKQSTNDDIETNNILREVPLRYLGYANEVGESFRFQFPRFVTPSYIVSFGYCFADATLTGYRHYQTNEKSTTKDNLSTTENNNHYDEEAMRIAMKQSADTLLWQSLASVLIPGFTINMIVRTSRLAITSAPMFRSFSPVTVGYLPTVIGLGSIPLIIHPIDNFVDYTLDNTIRQWFDLTSSSSSSPSNGQQEQQ